MTRIQTVASSVFARMIGGAVRASTGREDGQTLAEYALILGFIAVVCAVVVSTLGGQISSIFTSISNDL